MEDTCFNNYLKDSSNPSLEQSKENIREIYCSFPPVIFHNGIMLTNPAEVAEVLADHFANVSKQDPSLPFVITHNLEV